jgi:CDP-glycerol glycerophosphotransferase (TagB/SpsB family)
MTLSVLSYIVPKDKNLIVIGSKGGVKFFGNPKFFYLYLVKEQDYFKPIWITQNEKIFLDLKRRNLPVLMKYSLKGFFSILRARYLMIDHGISDISYLEFLPGRFNKIQAWHGTPLKVIGYKYSSETLFGSKKAFQFIVRNESKSYHTILSPSDDVKKIFKEVFENNKIYNLGYPRNDVFYDKEIMHNNYFKNLHLDNYSKIILFCPTYRETENPKMPFSDEFLKILDKYLKETNRILLIKGHVDEKNEISTENYSNIRNVSNKIEDIQEILPYVDTLITDYSSVFFDFVLMGKPIVFYPYDYNEYVDKRPLFFDYFSELPGPFVKNQDQLFEEIKNIDKNFQDKNYNEKFHVFNFRFNLFQNGGSCKRLLNHLIDDCLKK